MLSNRIEGEIFEAVEEMEDSRHLVAMMNLVVWELKIKPVHNHVM